MSGATPAAAAILMTLTTITLKDEQVLTEVERREYLFEWLPVTPPSTH